MPDSWQPSISLYYLCTEFGLRNEFSTAARQRCQRKSSVDSDRQECDRERQTDGYGERITEPLRSKSNQYITDSMQGWLNFSNRMTRAIAVRQNQCSSDQPGIHPGRQHYEGRSAPMAARA